MSLTDPLFLSFTGYFLLMVGVGIYSMRFSSKFKRGGGGGPYTVAWHDCGEVFRLGLKLDLNKLPSRCESFFIMGDNPQGKFIDEKTRRILGYTPAKDTTLLWRKVRE